MVLDRHGNGIGTNQTTDQYYQLLDNITIVEFSHGHIQGEQVRSIFFCFFYVLKNFEILKF